MGLGESMYRERRALQDSPEFPSPSLERKGLATHWEKTPLQMDVPTTSTCQSWCDSSKYGTRSHSSFTITEQTKIRAHGQIQGR